MTKFEGPLDFRDGYLPAARGLPSMPTIETAALLAVLARVRDSLPDCPDERGQERVQAPTKR